MDLATVSTLGAIIALVIAIILIFINVPPVYSLMLGALLGGIIGGVSVQDAIALMIDGSAGMMTTILRILAAGILAGVLIQTGAAESISQSIIKWLGKERALLALALAAMILTSVGVFIDISVITIAPIALVIARDTGVSRSGILLAMIGGGKAGNMISPNPNTIAVSEALDVPLTSVMASGIAPAIVGVIVTYFLAKMLRNKGSLIEINEIEQEKTDEKLPSFGASITGPVVAIILLALRPIANMEIDPLIALPIGGIIGSIVTGQGRDVLEYAEYGLEKMTGTAITLIGTGALAGIIQNSTLGSSVISLVDNLGMPAFLLAPIAGILMSGATASTTSGAAVASQVFGPALINAGVPNIASASMLHTGATVLDHLPHGSFFHATGGAVNMNFNERISLIGYETIVGLMITITSIILYGVLGIGV